MREVCPTATICPVYKHYLEVGSKGDNSVDVISDKGSKYYSCLALEFARQDEDKEEGVWDPKKGRVSNLGNDVGCAMICQLNAERRR